MVNLPLLHICENCAYCYGREIGNMGFCHYWHSKVWRGSVGCSYWDDAPIF